MMCSSTVGYTCMPVSWVLIPCLVMGLAMFS